MLRPPTTNDPALNRFLEEVASTIQDRVRPEEGWTLSDFASSVSEVISDKRDLINIVTQYDNIEVLTGEMEAEVARLKTDVQDSMDLLSSIESKSAEFAEVMEWWDQNYKIIFDAQAAMEIFGEISAALEGHQDILDQIAAATAVAENIVAEAKAAEDAANAAAEAAKTSETNATDAAGEADASAEAAGASAGEAAASATAAQESATAAAGNAEDADASARSAAESASNAKGSEDWIRDTALTNLSAFDASVNAAADRAEAAADGVDQVVSRAVDVLVMEIGDISQAISDDADAAGAARDQAVGAASTASTKADESAASAVTADSRATDAENAVASIAAHATDAEDAAGRAAVSESNAATSATTAEGHANRAASEAGTAAQIAAQEKIAELVGNAPSELDTIYELAEAFVGTGNAMSAIQMALANRIVGNYTVVVQSTPPQNGTTPSNQITFVTGGA